MPLEAISGDLAALGLQESSLKRLLEVMEVGDIDGVQSVLGKESPAANEVGYFCHVMIYSVIRTELIQGKREMPSSDWRLSIFGSRPRGNTVLQVDPW